MKGYWGLKLILFFIKKKRWWINNNCKINNKKYLSEAEGDENAKVIKYNGRNYLVSDDGTLKQVTWYVTINSEGRYVVTNGKKETEKVEIPLGTTINYDPYTGVESSKLTATTETEKKQEKMLKRIQYQIMKRKN